jgi:HK97 family phage prohead protease
MNFKQFAQVVDDLEPKQGIIKAYANAYNNVDSDNDISAPGSFTKTVTENFKRIRVLKDHNSTITLGVPKELNASDPYGLNTITQFNMNKEVSRDMFTDIQLMKENGQNAELSIGYSIVSRDQKDKRIINEYKLYEYSFLSSWAANPLAIATDLKGLKSPAYLIELLTKAYNMPYSDGKLEQIETILKSLTEEPGRDTTQTVEPIELVNHFKNLFTIN